MTDKETIADLRAKLAKYESLGLTGIAELEAKLAEAEQKVRRIDEKFQNEMEVTAGYRASSKRNLDTIAALTQKDITNNDLLRQAESRIGYLEGENCKLFAETAALTAEAGSLRDSLRNKFSYDRESLCRELREGFKKRGLWFPDNDGGDVIMAVFKALAPEPGKPAPKLARNQPCGCVVCNCEDPIQCGGCGARNCGTHPVGELPNPVYDEPAPGCNCKGEGLPHTHGDKPVTAPDAKPDGGGEERRA